MQYDASAGINVQSNKLILLKAGLKFTSGSKEDNNANKYTLLADSISDQCVSFSKVY